MIITNQTLRHIGEEIEAQNAILGALAGEEAGTHVVESFQDVKDIVSNGIAPLIFKTWEQFIVNHTVYDDLAFDIVAFDKNTNSNEHNMTMLLHDTLYGHQLGAQQALIACRGGLPAGTYHFTIDYTYSSWTAGTYQFTIPSALPEGGQLVLSGQASTAITSLKLIGYASPKDTTALFQIAVTSGNGGTDIGVVAAPNAVYNGTILNHLHRASYGSNNYDESAIDQWLNAEGYDWWNPMTAYDRPPTYKSEAGFFGGLPDDLKAVIEPTTFRTYCNTVFESQDSTHSKGDVYTMSRKIYLPSRCEIYGTHESTALADDSKYWDAYNDISNAERIKYDHTVNTARNWWLRSCYSSSASFQRVCYTTGSLDGSHAVGGNGATPAFTIHGESI